MNRHDRAFFRGLIGPLRAGVPGRSIARQIDNYIKETDPNFQPGPAHTREDVSPRWDGISGLDCPIGGLPCPG